MAQAQPPQAQGSPQPPQPQPSQQSQKTGKSGGKGSLSPWVIILALVLCVFLCAAPAGAMMGELINNVVTAEQCGGATPVSSSSPSQTGFAGLAAMSTQSQTAEWSSLIWQSSLQIARQFVRFQESQSHLGSQDLAGPAPTPTIPGSECGIDPNGNAIVAWALAISAHLYPCPISTSMDTCYDKGMPKAVIQYWQKTCPGCSQWQEGNLQCVMTVLAAYGLGDAPAPVVRGNAIGFWLNYSRIRGWVEIPSLFAPGSDTTLAEASSRGLPLPGDMIVFYISEDPLVGHIGVVVKMTSPTATKDGSLVFAEANGPTPLMTLSINPDLTVNVPWAGYFVAGYVRYIGLSSGTPSPTVG